MSSSVMSGGFIRNPTRPALSNNSLLSSVTPSGGNRPITAMRLQIDGDLQESEHDTGSAASWVNLSGQWDANEPNFNAANYEVFFDIISNAPTGSDTATWTGATTGAWISCDTERVWTFTKDDNTNGNAAQVIILEIREILTPSNTSGTANQTFSLLVTD